MSIRRVTCPACGAAANAPAAMANVKCPGCGTVWNVNNPVVPKKQAAQAEGGEKTEPEGRSEVTVAMFAGLVGGVMLLMMMIGLFVFLLGGKPDPKSSTAEAQVEDTIKPAIPEEYRVVNLPEEARKRLYDDYRKVARTTVEKPLILPQGTRPRQSLEDMLQKTFDRELMRFAALHDISVDDVKEVIKEGDAKQWDDRPRSHAVRDGRRVYPEEMSEGWEKNPNRK